MSISYIILAIALCASANNTFAMVQQTKQKEASAAQNSVCWMCKQKIAEGESSTRCFVQIVPMAHDCVLVFGGPEGKRYKSWTHTACYNPVVNYIKQHCLQQELTGVKTPEDKWKRVRDELLYAVYALVNAKKKTVQMCIQENDGDVPKAIVAIFKMGTMVTLCSEKE